MKFHYLLKSCKKSINDKINLSTQKGKQEIQKNKLKHFIRTKQSILKHMFFKLGKLYYKGSEQNKDAINSLCNIIHKTKEDIAKAKVKLNMINENFAKNKNNNVEYFLKSKKLNDIKKAVNNAIYKDLKKNAKNDENEAADEDINEIFPDEQ